MPVYRDNETVECWKGPESQPKPDTANERVLKQRASMLPSGRYSYLYRDESSPMADRINYLADHDDQR